jgi:hypothetical protein
MPVQVRSATPRKASARDPLVSRPKSRRISSLCWSVVALAAPALAAGPEKAVESPFGTTIYWAVDSFANPDAVSTAPVGTLSFTPVGTLSGVSLTGIDFDNTATTLWAVDNTAKTRGTIDLATGAYASHGLITGISGANLRSFRFDTLDTGLVFLLDDSHLYHLDLASGGATVLAGPFATVLFSGLAVSLDGVIYAYDGNSGNLYTISREGTGYDLIGPTGLNAATVTLDVDTETGVLWAWARQASSLVLLTVDTATGAATPVTNGAEAQVRTSFRLPVPLIFEDGFESEDLCEWSAQSGGSAC